jgi:hypothetical protein
MRAISHRAQVHKLFILATTARNVNEEALVRKRTMHELSAQAHELSIIHHVQAHKLLITAATTTYVDDKFLRATARGIHIGSCNGDDNNNDDDDDKCQRQGLVRKHTSFSYCDA